jgi:hypothetical protein
MPDPLVKGPKFQLKTLEQVIKDTEGAVMPPQLLDHFLLKGEFHVPCGVRESETEAETVPRSDHIGVDACSGGTV